MEKSAKKKSADPAQQNIRDAKSKWNDACSATIARLIAFKRGLNGRGDAKFSLPASNIKDPLPPQLGSFLQQLSSEFNTLVLSAANIVGIQNQYSKTRRKKQEKRLAYFKYELEKNASSKLSRFWTHFKGLFSFKEYKAFRLSMLSSSAKLNKDLFKLEDNALARNIKKTPEVIKAYVTVGSDIEVIKDIYYRIQTLMDEKKESDANLKKQIELKPGSELESAIENKPAVSSNVNQMRQHLLEISNDLSNARHSDVLSPMEIGSITELINDAMLSEDKSEENFALLVSNAEVGYLELIELVKKRINEKTGKDLPFNKLTELCQAYEEMEKVKTAGNFFTRWIKRNLHKATSSQIASALRLDISNLTKDARKIADELMDSLEKDLIMESIKIKIEELEKIYKNLNVSVSALNTIYMDKEYNKNTLTDKKHKDLIDSVLNRKLKQEYTRKM
jgi:hypothetical protein